MKSPKIYLPFIQVLICALSYAPAVFAEDAAPTTPAPETPAAVAPATPADAAPPAAEAAAAPAEPAAPVAEVPQPSLRKPANANYGVGSFSEEEYFDFQSQDTFMDVGDALKSKQYVRRAILSTVIKNTTQMAVGKYYVNHLIGFNAVLQKVPVYAKYVTGVQNLSAGYVSAGGHGGELGLELSSISALYAGYRYFYRPEAFLMWFSFGGGLGKQISLLSLGEGPAESLRYNGSTTLFYAGAAMMLPLVDVCFKAEIRFNFFGMDRLSLTSGVGALIFL